MKIEIFKKITETEEKEFYNKVDEIFGDKIYQDRKCLDSPKYGGFDLWYFFNKTFPGVFLGNLIYHPQVHTFDYNTTWTNNNYEGGEYEIKIRKAFSTGFSFDNDNPRVKGQEFKDLVQVDEKQLEKDCNLLADRILDHIFNKYEGDFYTTSKANFFRTRNRILHLANYRDRVSIFTSFIVNDKYKNPDSKVKKVLKLGDWISEEDVRAHLREILMTRLRDCFSLNNSAVESMEKSYEEFKLK